jgi:hypothetical protein
VINRQGQGFAEPQVWTRVGFGLDGLMATVPIRFGRLALVFFGKVVPAHREQMGHREEKSGIDAS